MQPILSATGLLVDRNAPESSRFLGSCFSFVRSTLFLTAAHLVEGRATSSLGVAVAFDDLVDPGLRVRRVEVHPTADVALLDIEFEPLEIFYSFPGIDREARWGEAVRAYGYPVDSPEDDNIRFSEFPTPRIFTGHIQRFFRYKDGQRNSYAAELSFPSPAGLSGGPLCRLADESLVVGVMVANRDALMYRGALETVDEKGCRIIERDIIRYGIAVMLRDIHEWIESATG